jgi:hypothetical protein
VAENIAFTIESKSRGEEEYAKLLENFRKLEAAQERLNRKNKEATDATVKGMKDSADATGRFDGVLQNLGATLAGVFSVATIQRFAQQYIQEINRIAEASEKMKQRTSDVLLSSGDALDPGRVAAFQKLQQDIKGTGSRRTFDEISTAFQETRGILRGQDQFQRSLDIVRTTETKGQYLSAGQASAVRQFMAIAAENRPNATPEELLAQAYNVTSAMGTDAGRLPSFMKNLRAGETFRGGSRESNFNTATAVVLSVARANQEVEAAQQIFDAVEKARRDPGKAPTLAALAEHSTAGAIDALMRGRIPQAEIAGVMETAGAGRLRLAQARWGEAQRDAARRGGVDLEAAGRAIVGESGVRRQRAIAAMEQDEMKNAEGAERLSSDWTESNLMMRSRMPVGTKWLGSTMAGVEFGFRKLTDALAIEESKSEAIEAPDLRRNAAFQLGLNEPTFAEYSRENISEDRRQNRERWGEVQRMNDDEIKQLLREIRDGVHNRTAAPNVFVRGNDLNVQSEVP